jgi:hypothetical protein
MAATVACSQVDGTALGSASVPAEVQALTFLTLLFFAVVVRG